MAENQIKQAKNNIDRQNTYKQQLGRYTKAMRYGFYFEAMLIAYSMLEDRLKSFLYYCGFFDNRNTIKISKKIKADIKVLLFDENPAKWPSLNNISTKIAYIKALLIWANTVQGETIQDNDFYCNLKSTLESVDIGAMLVSLNSLTEWLKYRNEIMHASMNKNVDSLYENLNVKVADGMEIARFIDSQVKLLKKSGTIRRYLRMQMN